MRRLAIVVALVWVAVWAYFQVRSYVGPAGFQRTEVGVGVLILVICPVVLIALPVIAFVRRRRSGRSPHTG